MKTFFLNVLDFVVFKHTVLFKILLTGLAFLSFLTFCNATVSLILLAGLVVHEYGHVLALKYLGIQNKGFFPVPFLGAVTIFDAKQVLTQRNNFIISIAGPALGALGGLGCLIAYKITGNEVLGFSAFLMVILNLFNMLPTAMLDGGKIYDVIVSGLSPTAQKISYSIISAATLALGIVLLKTLPIMAVMLILFATMQFFTKVRNPQPSPFAPMTSPVHTSICVVIYMASILGMLAMLKPLLGINFWAVMQ